MAESTPLLDEINESTPHIDTNHEEFEGQTNLSAEQTRAPAYFKILRIITLVLSTLTIALLIANYIIIKYVSFGGYTWSAKEAIKTLGNFIFVSLVFSVINVLVNFPILLNTIVDVVLAAGIIPWVIRLLEAFPSSAWCWNYRYEPGNPRPEPIPPTQKCQDWKLVVQILMGIAAGFGGIIAAIYIGLLILRSVAIFRTKFWKKSTWTFPTGQITLQISLNVLRQENVTTVGQSAEAGSTSGHGPLYL